MLLSNSTDENSGSPWSYLVLSIIHSCNYINKTWQHSPRKEQTFVYKINYSTIIKQKRMNPMNFPRVRAKNFTPKEERILENLIFYHKDIINSKQNDSKMWTKKAEAWKQIANDFALQSGMERPWQALREKYTNNQRLNRRRFLNVRGEDGLMDDTKVYNGNLTIAAVSTLAGDHREEESKFGTRKNHIIRHKTSSQNMFLARLH